MRGSRAAAPHTAAPVSELKVLKSPRPKEYFVRAERAVGNRQDLCVEGAKAPFIMRVYYARVHRRTHALGRLLQIDCGTVSPSKTVAGAG